MSFSAKHCGFFSYNFFLPLENIDPQGQSISNEELSRGYRQQERAIAPRSFLQGRGKIEISTLPGMMLCCSAYKVAFYLRDVVSAVNATATWLAGWVAGWPGVRHTPVLYQNG